MSDATAETDRTEARPRPGARARAVLARLTPARRTWLRWMHLAMIPLTVWFMIATPDFVRRVLGPKGAAINSDIAVIFVTLALIWSVHFFYNGLAGKPGPKLSPRLKTFHRLLHKTILVGLFLVPVGGFLLGLTSHRMLFAGGWLPIAPALGLEHANEVIGKAHIIQFYTLGGIIALHAGFHIWRHVRLKDNALRIMAPRVLHRWL